MIQSLWRTSRSILKNAGSTRFIQKRGACRISVTILWNRESTKCLVMLKLRTILAQHCHRFPFYQRNQANTRRLIFIPLKAFGANFHLLREPTTMEHVMWLFLKRSTDAKIVHVR